MRKFVYGLFGLTVLGTTWLIYNNFDIAKYWPKVDQMVAGDVPVADAPASDTVAAPATPPVTDTAKTPVATTKTVTTPPSAVIVTTPAGWKIDAQLPILKKTGHGLLLRQNKPEWLGNVPGNALRVELVGDVILEELHFGGGQTFASVLNELKAALVAQKLTLQPGAFGPQSWYFLVDGHTVNLAPIAGGVLAVAFPAGEFNGWKPFLGDLFQ